MKSEYRRISFDNYICFWILKDEIKKEYEYELKVLENNEIKGLLKTHISSSEQEIELNFNINHTQNLRRFIERKIWKKEDLNTFLGNFCKSLKSFEEFILDVDKILLNIEYIFIEPESLKVYLCYLPISKRDINKSISEILFIMIDKIKTEDNRVLNTLHTCYKMSKLSEFCLEDIERELEKDCALDNKKENRVFIKSEQSRVNQDSIVDVSIIDEENYEYEKDEKDVPTFSIKTLFSKKKKSKKEELSNKEKDWEDLLSLDTVEEDEKEEYEKEDTVLLNTKLDNKNPYLRCMLDPKLNIEIKYFPFVIGRQERLCDYCLDIEGVSRVHFRIEKIDEDFVVCDLNSRNGIKVEGRILENEEYCVIKRGNKLEIAGLTYVFE